MNNTKPQKFFTEIVLLHLIGALMIFFGHVAQWFHMGALGELLISGVPLFLFVSGFLVGSSNKEPNTAWLKRKAQRILVPYYIVLLIVFACFVCFSTEMLKPLQWWPQFLNIQGLTNFLFFNDFRLWCSLETRYRSLLVCYDHYALLFNSSSYK